MADPQPSAMRTSLRPTPPPPPPNNCPTCGRMPEQNVRRAYQEVDDTCSIASARMIIRQQTGRDVPEAELAKRAQELGAYTPGTGTNTASQAYLDLLGEYGVQARSVETNIPMMIQPLADRPRGFVGPDSPAVVNVRGGPLSTDIDHSVVVDGVHTQPGGQVVLRVNDPATAYNPTGNTYWETREHLMQRAAGGSSIIVLPRPAATPSSGAP